MQTFSDWTFSIGNLRFGWSHDRVDLTNGKPYLERWILWLGITFRLHKFWSGDDDRAPHNHPWSFITVPLNRSYRETVYWTNDIRGFKRWDTHTHTVKRRRPHYRHWSHAHIVKLKPEEIPVWTFVVTGLRCNKWGFFPDPNTFVYWRDWESMTQDKEPAAEAARSS